MKVLLVAVNAKYIHSNLAVYSLKAYAEKYGKNEYEIKIKEYTINQYTEEIVADIYEEQADVIGFSCYIWNIQQVMEAINDLKSVCPKQDIWVGGPEVSYNAVQILSDNTNIDYVMCGEGEEIFKQFLDNYHEGKLQSKDIDGLVYREAGQIKANPMMEPVEISNIPFVYKDMKDFENKIIYYETSRGCPFSCSYCLSSIDKKIRFRNLDLVKEELQFFIYNKTAQVKFVDRTFNCNPKHAMEIWKYIKDNDNGITNFHFEIAADLMTEEELKLISGMRPGLIQLEIGVQSANERTLQAIHRKTDIGEIENITGRILQNKNIHQHLDLIAGLPYEDYSSFRNSFNRVYAMKPDQLQLGFLKVLYGAGISEEAKEYGIVFSNRPPYEVLKTKWLTFDEVLRLKEIETVVEIYYNSLQFSETIKRLEEYFNSPFDMYERLGRYYKKCSVGGVKHSRENRYVLLLNFIMEELNLMEEDSFSWKELLTLDFYLRENAKKRPVFAKSLEDYKQNIHKIYCHPELKQKLNGYVNYSSRQIEHMTHIEILKGQYILFDYKNRNALTKAADTVDVTTYLQL